MIRDIALFGIVSGMILAVNYQQTSFAAFFLRE
jgi:hypothetical protein